MRIGVNTFQLHQRITGAGRFTKNLLRALAEQDRENEYVLFLRRDNAGYYSVNQDNFKNIETKVTSEFRLKRIYREQYLLPKLAKEHNIDIFWSPSDISPASLPCISIVTIHDLKRFVLPEEFPFFERNYYRIFLKRTARSSDLIFTVSESSGRDIMKYLDVPPERIVVAHNGLDPDMIDEEGIPFETLNRIHNVNRKYILFVGQMIKSKNVPRMIRAFSQCEEAKDYDLVLIGKQGAGTAEVIQTMRKEDQSGNLKERIHLIPWVTSEQLVSFYKHASVLFYASLYEGFGFPLIEAMVNGLPIITSNVSSMPEVAGDAAVIVDPKDVGQMAETLGKVLTDHTCRENLIEKGYERFRTFSWENTAKKYLAVFNRLK